MEDSKMKQKSKVPEGFHFNKNAALFTEEMVAPGGVAPLPAPPGIFFPVPADPRPGMPGVDNHGPMHYGVSYAPPFQSVAVAMGTPLQPAFRRNDMPPQRPHHGNMGGRKSDMDHMSYIGDKGGRADHMHPHDMSYGPIFMDRPGGNRMRGPDMLPMKDNMRAFENPNAMYRHDHGKQGMGRNDRRAENGRLFNQGGNIHGNENIRRSDKSGDKKSGGDKSNTSHDHSKSEGSKNRVHKSDSPEGNRNDGRQPNSRSHGNSHSVNENKDHKMDNKEPKNDSNKNDHAKIKNKTNDTQKFHHSDEHRNEHSSSHDNKSSYMSPKQSHTKNVVNNKNNINDNHLFKNNTHKNIIHDNAQNISNKNGSQKNDTQNMQNSTNVFDQQNVPKNNILENSNTDTSNVLKNNMLKNQNIVKNENVLKNENILKNQNVLKNDNVLKNENVLKNDNVHKNDNVLKNNNIRGNDNINENENENENIHDHENIPKNDDNGNNKTPKIKESMVDLIRRSEKRDYVPPTGPPEARDLKVYRPSKIDALEMKSEFGVKSLESESRNNLSETSSNEKQMPAMKSSGMVNLVSANTTFGATVFQSQPSQPEFWKHGPRKPPVVTTPAKPPGPVPEAIKKQQYVPRAVQKKAEDPVVERMRTLRCVLNKVTSTTSPEAVTKMCKIDFEPAELPAVANFFVSAAIEKRSMEHLVVLITEMNKNFNQGLQKHIGNSLHTEYTNRSKFDVVLKMVQSQNAEFQTYKSEFDAVISCACTLVNHSHISPKALLALLRSIWNNWLQVKTTLTCERQIDDAGGFYLSPLPKILNEFAQFIAEQTFENKDTHDATFINIMKATESGDMPQKYSILLSKPVAKVKECANKKAT